jgi:hypothetical protein
VEIEYFRRHRKPGFRELAEEDGMKSLRVLSLAGILISGHLLAQVSAGVPALAPMQSRLQPPTRRADFMPLNFGFPPFGNRRRAAAMRRAIPESGTAPAGHLFLNAPTYATPAVPAAVAIADFNRDGIPDLAVTSDTTGTEQRGATVSILLGNGDGTFQPYVNYYAHKQDAGNIAVGDFNGDGNLDLAIDTYGDNYIDSWVTVFPGNGDGTFGTPKSFGAPVDATSIQTADFNGDGKLDLVTSEVSYTSTCGDGYEGQVSVMLGDGDGTFGTATVFETGVDCTWSVQVADVNGDGKPDLVAASGASNLGFGSASVLLGRGDGTFATAVVYGSDGLDSESVAIGDLNGDAKPDLILINDYDLASPNDDYGSVTVFLGNGDGTFQSGTDFLAGYSGGGLVGDVNGDGKLDVLTNATNGIDVMLGNGDGTLTYRAGYIGGYGYGLAAADLNGDGKLDVALGNGGAANVEILLGNGNGSFNVPRGYIAGYEPASGVAGDFNGDGKLDLLVTDVYGGPEGSGNLSLLSGLGNGVFSSPTTLSVGVNPDASVSGDFNHDGKLDVAIGNGGSGDVSILLGNGDGTFQPAVNYPVQNGAYSIVAADFNHDGNLDLAVSDFVGYYTGDVSVLLGNSDGTFQSAVSYQLTIDDGGRILAADLNHDGNPDLIIGGSYWTVILKGNGDGTFSPGAELRPCYSSDSVVVADFNGDGKPDLGFSCNFAREGNSVNIFLGNGDGTFQPRVSTLIGVRGTVLTAADIDGDGHVDLAVGGWDTNEMLLLLGNGDGTFQPPTTYWTGTYRGGSLIVTDLNGDHLPDILSVNDSDSVTVLIQQQTGQPKDRVRQLQ